MSEAHWLSAAEIAERYRKATLSPVELMRALLARIDAHDTKLNAFIDVGADRALEDAREAEREIRAGRIRGPLHGVPVALKDIIDVAGLRTSCHSKIMANHVAKADAAVVSRLRAAGAILLGKLALHEFAFGGPAFDLPYPPARNPWNRQHMPGGSSSGAGTAVAAGMVPLALGTDTGGSVRNPAGACGIVGLKPTYGLVSRRGVFPLAFTLDHVGPLTRTVKDSALLLNAIAGYDPADPGSAPSREADFGRDLDRGLKGLRVGFVRHFHEHDIEAEAEMAASLTEAARTLASEGAMVRDVTLPSLRELTGVHRVTLAAEAWSVHSKWLREQPGSYAAATRKKLMMGAFLTAEDYIQAQRARGLMMAAIDDAFGDFDVLLTANAMDPACRIDDEEALARTYPRQARGPFNLTGHPAIVLMSGLTKAGLPLSLQLVSRHFDEATLFRAANGYERASGYAKRRPALDDRT